MMELTVGVWIEDFKASTVSTRLHSERNQGSEEKSSTGEKMARRSIVHGKKWATNVSDDERYIVRMIKPRYMRQSTGQNFYKYLGWCISLQEPECRKHDFLQRLMVHLFLASENVIVGQPVTGKYNGGHDGWKVGKQGCAERRKVAEKVQAESKWR